MQHSQPEEFAEHSTNAAVANAATDAWHRRHQCLRRRLPARDRISLQFSRIKRFSSDFLNFDNQICE
jgi:hypothetical protein